ncbi:MAG: ATP-binding protein [bacterium]
MFENIAGHKNIKEYLEKALKENRCAHAYLFAGAPRVGKFSMALEFACQIMGEKFRKDIYLFRHPDFVVAFPFLKKDVKLSDTYLNALSLLLQEKLGKSKERTNLFSYSGNETIPVDVVREIIQVASSKTYISEKRVVIVKNAEMMRKEAANTFLKILEEPPKSTMFILTADNINGVIPTIVSRCQIMKFGYLSGEDITKHLLSLGKSPEEVKRLVYLMDGSMNDALCRGSVLDRDEVVSAFLADDREALFKLLFKSSKKQEDKSSVLIFLKIIYKYLSDSLLCGESKFEREEAERIMDEILLAERDLKLNFQPNHVVNYILDASYKKDEVTNVR